LIERAVVLWSNPGDLIFSPFAGIGSEGYGAIRAGRRFLGIELKQAYYDRAILNLMKAAVNNGQLNLLDQEAS
jgi:DNA modification methylase